MTDYWKSLTKKYCQFCQCWITENKSSIEFHERGLRHQANVRKRVKEIQKNSTIQEKEKFKYNLEIQKIEAAALNSFQSDVARDPLLSNEIANVKSKVAETKEKSSADISESVTFNRFGECSSTGGESETLINGRKRALETIEKAFEKKSKWLEAKSAEGSIFYWNKDSLETRHQPPKSGFLSLEEQKQLKNLPSSSRVKEDNDFASLSNRASFGGWKAVNRNEDNKFVDLQLPSQDITQVMLDIKQNSCEKPEESDIDRPVFKEKTIDTLSKSFKTIKAEDVGFKKRANVRRNIRSRCDA